LRSSGDFDEVLFRSGGRVNLPRDRNGDSRVGPVSRKEVRIVFYSRKGLRKTLFKAPRRGARRD